MNAYPEELSGGEQQRVAIARALVNDPQLVLADEPTGNLDPDLSLEIMNLFREINARGTTVLVATHDRELIRRVGRRAITLEHGLLVGGRVSALRYAFDEASLSLWRRWRANGLSVLTITIALFVLGVFLLLHANIQHWLADWSQAAEVSVYLARRSAGRSAAAIEEVLTHNRAAVSREYVSPDEAMRRFARLFPELAASAKTIGDQPLPASFEVRLAPGAVPTARWICSPPSCGSCPASAMCATTAGGLRDSRPSRQPGGWPGSRSRRFSSSPPP